MVLRKLCMLGAVAALAGGCYAHADVPVGSVEITSAPVGIATAPYVLYHGRAYYWYGRRWYYNDGGRWNYYLGEPHWMKHGYPHWHY